MKKKLIIIGIIIFILISVFLLYCRFIGTSGFIVKEYLIKNEKLPDSFYGMKIVHLTDIHYGRTVDDKKLKNIVNKVNEIKPDIVIITGDLLDKDINYQDKDLEIIANHLNSINASTGKYIIEGNHDLNVVKYSYLLEKLNFVNLNDTYQILYNQSNDAIMISGLSTIINNKSIEEKTSEIMKAMENNKNIKYNILILHEPDVITSIDYKKFDLILGGHSHGGQVRLPFIGPILLPPNAKKYHESYYDLGNTDLYISSGLGTSNMNFRLNNKPSFNLYRLVKK